ncbi:MAG: hypothetical protein O2821_01820 [Chloroflexi bacterium]|nr:hypothetical protein [Chloroflexota bacterium]MDA1228206.1 hypothetical protein [Chloroflexota bacterium]
MIGILGASQYESVLVTQDERTVITTRFGDVPILLGSIAGQEVAYIRRFGWENNLASNVVNHAANAMAFRSLGVRRAITMNGFGGVGRDIELDDLVIYHDYIRMVERTPTTIFVGEPRWPRAHMRTPFCPEIRTALADSSRQNSSRRVIDQAVNICVQGPHDETPAEVEAYRRLGADIICTTVYPEVVYFRELEICFAGIAWVCDMAGEAGERDWAMITPEELTPIMRAAVAAVPDTAACNCQSTWVGMEEKLPAWYREMR